MAMLATWDKDLSIRESVTFYTDLALEHCRLAGNCADAVAELIRDGNFLAVCRYEVDYSDPSISVMSMLHLRQALGFFSKLEPLELGIDKQSMALEQFMASEYDCCITNNILNMTSSGKFSLLPDVERVLSHATRKIEAVLGETVPSLSELELVFGPGATTSVLKRNASAREKLSTVPSCSANMLPLVPLLYKELPRYLGHHMNLNCDDVGSEITVDVDIGKLSFVPKNATTMRSVMTEPTLNGLVQGGFGRYITKRLRRVGQDTRDQTRNRRLAKLGSETGALATLDLSRASDSISYELVAALLPYEWFAALALCRTDSALLPSGEVLVLQKFRPWGMVLRSLFRP